MILIERSKFALLVRSHMKASNMLLILQHVCRERRISLSMTQEEVCQLIRLDPDFVEKYKRRGKLCPVEDQDGKQYYNVLDFINLKDMQESKRIFYQTMGILSVLVAIGLCWLILFPEYPKHRY